MYVVLSYGKTGADLTRMTPPFLFPISVMLCQIVPSEPFGIIIRILFKPISLSRSSWVGKLTTLTTTTAKWQQ